MLQPYAPAMGSAMTHDLEDLKAIWLDLMAHVEQLAGERQHYLDFFEQSPEAYVISEADGTIRDANPAAVDILQCRRRSLRGKPLATFVALERRAEFRTRMNAVAARASPAEGCWRTIFVAAGERTEVTLTARPVERQGIVGGLCWRLEAMQ
jgi:PAS domain S-box-containing protein